MAFIGTPLDTRNTFQSLVGKRFNGDGSTTAFTLDVAPSSTLDIEVFVGNVRQDPNSAYTLSGTTLTFTGAPPSGTNNIYVVHQAKAVGTIEIPATTGSEKTFTGGVVIADDSDGSNGLKIGTGDDFKIYHDGTHTYMDNNTGALFMRNNGSVIIEDLSGNNIIRGIDGAAVDLYHNGTSVLNTTATGATVTTLGVINEKDLGVGLHIKSADSGASVASGADELVVEGSADAGLSILSGTDANGSIMFGDSADNDGGRIQYNPNNDRMMFTTAGTERMRLKSNGYLGVTGTAGTGIERRLSVYGSHVSEDGLVWIQTSNGSGDDNLVLFFDGNTNNCGEITLDANGNTVAYVTSSDYRLKQNATDIADGITRLKQLKPYRFQWKSDPDNTVDGFFAHEAQEIVPESVKGTKDAMKTAENVVVNADGSVECYNIAKADWEQGKIDGKYASNSTWQASKSIIDRQGIDQSKLVPLLTAALKESIAKIEALEARVTTLEE